MADLVMTPQEEDPPATPEGAAQETEPKTEEIIEGEETKTEEDPAAAKTEEDPAKKEEDPPADPTDTELLATQRAENLELRTLLRDGKRDITTLTDRISASEAALEKAGLISEEDKQATAAKDAAFESRQKELGVILEMTRLSAQFEDVDTVVSQANFDAAIDVMAVEYAKTNAVSQQDAIGVVEDWVWSQVNPYRYMYGVIKESLPAFKQVVKEENKLPAKSPDSIQNIHGGASSVDLTGWTSAKIDGLPEDELASVPKDVYAKYLRNELK